MKSILLASASIVAVTIAGAASAEITWSGEATLGYNDDAIGDNEGFYWDLEIDVTLSQTLDNGLTAGAEFGFEAADDTDDAILSGDGDLGQILEAKDFVLFLESDMAAMYFGNTDFAAQKHWTSAGDMESDGFSEQDGETVLRGDVMYNGIEASLSYIISDLDGLSVDDIPGNDDSLAQLSIGAKGTFGNFTVGMAYQEEIDPVVVAGGNWNGDINPDEIFGIFGSTTLGAADVTVAYASNNTDDTSSLGLKVAYPFGPVTATAYYVMEEGGANEDPNMGLNIAYANGPITATLDLQDDQGDSKWSLQTSYDVGSGLVVYAGIENNEDDDGDENDYYIAGEMDLGGGASFLVSYAEDEDNDQGDEIGQNDYQRGTTVAMTFEF